MAFQHDDLSVSHQLIVGEGFPTFLGVGPGKIRGSTYIEGPAVMGEANAFPNINATLMIGPNKNVDSSEPKTLGALCGVNFSPYSLAVVGDAVIFDNISINKDTYSGGNIVAQGDVLSNCGGHRLSSKKNFDIPHPSKEGWRLRHTCPEAPYNDVYIRGRLKNSSEIILPEYWKDFVDITSITVSITPIGSHQDIIVKTITETKITLQSKGVLPINCFYHVFAERKDGEKLIPEYQGNSASDYPGNPDEYSVVGFNYDRRI